MNIKLSDIDLSTLAISSKNPDTKTQHFPFFILDNYVDQSLYEKLSEEFPSTEELSISASNRFFINNRHLEDAGMKKAFLKDRPAWRKVLEVLSSQEFMDDFSAYIRPKLFRHRFLGACRKWRKEKALMPPFDRAVQLTYQWGGMRPGSYLNPHTDKAAKLATFIWHFPEPGWRDEDQGATLFMTAKRAQHNMNWANFKLPFEELDVLERSEVKPNRLVMFAKTGNSWHGVPTVMCGEHVMRRAFIFNYRYPVEVANSFTTRAFESFHRRSQGWLFKEFDDVNRKPEM
jgi:hypothetical protein